MRMIIRILYMFLLISIISAFYIIAENKIEKDNKANKKQIKIENLIEVLEDPSLGGNKWLEKIKAVRELGHLRAVKGIDVLVEKLDWDIKIYSSGGILTREDRFPAMLALLRIGEPAIEGIMKGVIEKQRSNQFISNASWTIVRIIGASKKPKKEVKNMANIYLKRLNKFIDNIPEGIYHSKGQVVAVRKDKKSGDVVIDISCGLEDGVKEGLILYIITRDKNVYKAEVTKAVYGIAMARLIFNTDNKIDQEIDIKVEKGNKITTKKPNV